MNIKPIGIAIAIFGQLLLVAIFVLLLPVTLFVNPAVMWLDLTVVSLNYWLWVATLFREPINLDDKSQKQVAALGIRWQGSFIYSLLSIGFIFIAISAGIEFKWQLFTQCVFIFLLLILAFTVLGVNEKTRAVYEKESVQKAGKQSIKRALSDVIMEGSDKERSSECYQSLEEY